VKLSLCLSTTPWRRIGRVEVLLHALLTLTLDGGEWPASRSRLYRHDMSLEVIYVQKLLFFQLLSVTRRCSLSLSCTANHSPPSEYEAETPCCGVIWSLHQPTVRLEFRYWSRGSSGSIVTRLRAGRRRVRFLAEVVSSFSLPPFPGLLWGPPSLLSNGYRGSCPRDKATAPWSWTLASP
jgi:hypothetical protein